MQPLTRTFAKEAKSINRHHALLLKELRSAGERAANIGAMIQRVKDGLPYGTFERWAEDNLSFGPRQARRYMEFWGRVATLESPSQAMLTAEWQEIQNPAAGPVRTYTSVLSDTERAESMKSEGGVEPEERAEFWMPGEGEMSVGFAGETIVILAHRPDRPGFVEVYVVEDGDGEDNCKAFPRGVCVDALPAALVYVSIDPVAVAWSGVLPLDRDLRELLRSAKCAAA